MSGDLDPSLLQDFLTESNELIEQLDSDLVKLERSPTGDEARELLNGVFRALHTVKGAASFLNLTAVTTFAHAAEDALNRLRKGEVAVTPGVMDAMLRSVDVLRSMVGALGEGRTPDECPKALIDQLHAIAAAASDAAPAPGAGNPAAPAAAEPAAPQGTRPLKLPSQKQDLLGFMVADLQQSAEQLEHAVAEFHASGNRTEVASHLAELAESTSKTTDFFELDALTRLIRVVGNSAGKLAEQADDIVEEGLIRYRATAWLIARQAEALDRSLVMEWPLDQVASRIGQLAAGGKLDVAGRHGNDIQKVLELDGVLNGSASAAPLAAAAEEAAKTIGEHAEDHPDAKVPDKAASAPQAGKAAVVEQTIRVEVGRLEALLNLVGQLVLTKNRVLAMSRRLRDTELAQEFVQDVATAAGDLDRLTSELQVGVMRTRMQPLGKLFERYPRVIRDMSRMIQKKINLEITGKDTEVDKSVLELLADPLVHILRNSADHGIELPEKRVAAGKSEIGTIRLSAEHQGSHVRVEIRDDGKGIDREAVTRKAIEKGLITSEQLTTMSEQDVLGLIFAPGLSTADKVSDLSGRGVGMDVVRSNVNKMNGVIHVASTPGQGTTIEILIPLTVAIMPAMVVGVGRHLYCVPLQSILEIVRPESQTVHTVKGQPVMRLRDLVLPLIDLRSRLGETGEGETRFAVVIAVGEQKVGLMVDRLIGQQEIVIKPLDDEYVQGGPFSGATIREDGDVSLILDVVQLVRQVQTPERPGTERQAA
jgi:two-component system chemotaxis sensor kinase CheA